MDVKNAKSKLAGSTSRRDWTPEQLSGSHRYRLEKLAGGSFARVLDCIDTLKLGNADGQVVTRSGITYKMEKGDTPDKITIKVGPDGPVPSFGLTIGSGEKEKFLITEVQLLRIDPARPDYEYPERIASGTVLQRRDDGKISGHGFLSLRQVPEFVKAMDFFRPLMPAVSKPDPARKIGDIVLEDADKMRIDDGGLCGPATLAFAREAQASIAGIMMKWAAVAMPEVNDAMERRGFTWGKSYLNYNDLDNNAFAIPMPDDNMCNPRFALFHENISLISEYSAYVAIGTRGEHGILSNIELIGLDRSKDDTFEICATVNAGDFEGRGTPIANFNHESGYLGIPGGVDEIGLLDSFCFYLSCDHEMVAEGQMDIGRYREDARICHDFERFRLEAFEDDDLDGSAFEP
jgi:hypothetical protein